MDPQIFHVSTLLSVSFALGLGAFFVYRNPKKIRGETFYFLLWACGSLWWLFVALGNLINPYSKINFGIASTLLAFQIYFGLLFALAQFKLPKIIFQIIAGIFTLLLIGFFYFLINAQTTLLFYPGGIPATKVSLFGENLSIFIFPSLVVIASILISFLIVRAIKNGEISWEDPSLFYILMAPFIYLILTLPAAFLVFAGSLFLLLHFLIPLLIFLAYGSKK
jgi:hypothetical protein